MIPQAPRSEGQAAEGLPGHHAGPDVPDSHADLPHCDGGGGRNGPLTVGSGTPPLPGPEGQAAEGREGHLVGDGEGQVHRGGRVLRRILHRC